jgi:hypothetical protein
MNRHNGFSLIGVLAWLAVAVVSAAAQQTSVPASPILVNSPNRAWAMSPRQSDGLATRYALKAPPQRISLLWSRPGPVPRNIPLILCRSRTLPLCGAAVAAVQIFGHSAMPS